MGRVFLFYDENAKRSGGTLVRNILQYPMTYPEAIEILNKFSVEILSQKLIGDIRPYALQWTIGKLKEQMKQEMESSECDI